MKFSRSKKAKIRRNNQRRINKNCKDMIGCCIDFEHGYKVKDQAKINGIMYLLVKVENDQFAIYKIVKVGNYVRLSNKKVLENQKDFSNYVYWRNDSTIQISEEGEIVSVKRTIREVIWENNEPAYIFVVKD